MKNKFTSIIMFLVVILIITVCIIFGEIIWQEIKSTQTVVEPEKFKTVFEDFVVNTSKDEQKTNQVESSISQKMEDNYSKELKENNIDIDKFFYNQLDKYSKIIYKAIDENKENMKTGTYKVELGDKFTNILASENGEEELGKYYQSAIEAYNYDNPSIFYLDPNKMYLNIETTTKYNKKTYKVYLDNGKETNYLTKEFSSKQEIDEAISKITEVKSKIMQNRSGNTYEDIKMVHDYLIDKVEYDTTISKNNIYNLYGALVNGEAVCEGYARAFKYIMDELEIPCIMVIGKATNSEGKTENHAWNYVQLDGTWYAIDVTWDDPIITGGWLTQRNKYKYFLKGSKEINSDHLANGKFSDKGMLFKYPELSEISY